MKTIIFSLVLVAFSVFMVDRQTKRGICSWYWAEGENPAGRPTSCGRKFDRNAMVAALWPELPCGTKIRVTDEDTGKSVIVVVNDRFGGASKDRIVDLTYGAFGKLASDQGRIKRCRYNVVK